MKLIQHVWMACIGLCLFSCTQTDELETAQGKTGFIVSLTDGTKLDVSRATPGDIVDSEGIEGADFNLRIVNAETEGEIYNDKVGTEVIKAYSGVYDLTATYGENPVLALDAPYFKGETTGVEVFNNKTTPVTIACKVANALVSVTYDNSKALFEDVYSNYYVEVKVGEESVEIKDVAQSAYMQAGSAFEVIFHGTPKDANEDKSVVLDTEFGVPATLNAGDHLKLTLSPKLDRFDIPLSIESVAVETAPLTEEIPMEWLPKPKVEAEGFTNNELSFVETEQKNAKLNLTLSSALQDIKFKFNFEDEQFAGVLPKEEYLLSNAEDKQAIETALGITLPAIGATEASVDLSDLVGKLQTNAGTTTNNAITIDAKANDRWSSEETYTLVCNKPEFSVSVQPENCWSWEFTIDEVSVTSGDADKIKSNLVYQYYNGTNWVDCNNGLTQKFEIDESRKNVYLTDTPEARTYQVRALYRGAVASEESTATLEEPWQLPNSGMEEWYRADTDWDFPNYIPRSTSGEDEFWDTDNEFTFRYDIPSPKDWYDSAYNGFPAVSYSTEYKHNGNRSAELRNTGAGPVSTGNSTYSDNEVAGMLFIGNYTGTTSTLLANGNISIDEGRTFTSRPTRLSFYYTYEPYGTDTYEVIVKVFDAEGNVIGSGNHTSNATQPNWTEQIISINYSPAEDNVVKKANKIYVFFQSSNAGQGNVPYEKKRPVILADYGKATTHSGSVLRIDDISLSYDKQNE